MCIRDSVVSAPLYSRARVSARLMDMPSTSAIREISPDSRVLINSWRPPKWSSKRFINRSPIPGKLLSTIVLYRLSRAFEDNPRLGAILGNLACSIPQQTMGRRGLNHGRQPQHRHHEGWPNLRSRIGYRFQHLRSSRDHLGQCRSWCLG